MKPPIPYFGGKTALAARLAYLLPPHQTYVEVFGGSGALLFAKAPSPVEVYNDLDGGLVNFYRVLRDPEELRRLLELTPYSREEYNAARVGEAEDRNGLDGDPERARQFFVNARMSYAARQVARSWSYSVRASNRSCAKVVSAFLSSVEGLPEVHARLRGVQVDRGDFRDILERYDRPDTLFYLDPPYVPGTRRSGEYRQELTLENHRDLTERCLHLEGKAILSGYQHPIYEPLEWAGWLRGCFRKHLTAKPSHTETEYAEDWLWVSPRAQTPRLREVFGW